MWRYTLNERLRILKLLEEGKINAEEAARLLEALSQSETKERKRRYKIWSSIEAIPEVIASTINSSFKNIISRETLQFSKREKIEFKGVSGEIEITGYDTDTIEIEKEGFAKIMENDNRLEIKAISGNIKMKIPMTTDLAIKGVSGNINISRLNSVIEIASVSGDIKGEELSGTFIGDFVTGDVDLDYKSINKIRVKSKSGYITLRLDETIETHIEVVTEDGSIDCDFDLKDEEKTDTLLKGTLNKPTAQIFIKNDHGDVAIKKRQ